MLDTFPYCRSRKPSSNKYLRNMFNFSLSLIHQEAGYEKLKLFQTRLYKYSINFPTGYTYTSITCWKIEHIPNNKFFTTTFNDSSIFFMELFESVVGE